MPEQNPAFDNILRIAVPKDKIAGLCGFLKETPDLEFDYLSFITAADRKDFFEMTYLVYSNKNSLKLILKTQVERVSPLIDTVSGVWKTALWNEREVYDMFGIKFTGHPDLKRILLPEDWDGYPLRKDYVHKPDQYD